MKTQVENSEQIEKMTVVQKQTLLLLTLKKINETAVGIFFEKINYPKNFNG
jgi:hypothetical protein